MTESGSYRKVYLAIVQSMNTSSSCKTKKLKVVLSLK